jgi:ubiquinone/menaquinone biosynthesis C-methylase UbiE
MNELRYSTEPEDSIGFTKRRDRYYTVLATLYDAALRRLPVWKTWLGRALPHIEGPRILEVSFGTGYLLSHCAHRVEAHGVDYNRQMVEIARRTLSCLGSTAALIQANVESLPYRDGSFDSLVNTMAFSGYPHGGRALAEMARVLRPGGKLILIDFSYPRNRNWIGTNLVVLLKLTGDLIRDMKRIFDELGLDYSDEEIGGSGSVHLYVATKPSSTRESSTEPT